MFSYCFHSMSCILRLWDGNVALAFYWSLLYVTLCVCFIFQLTLQFRFKPLEISKLVAPCREEFERLFHITFSVKDNAQYLNNIQVSVHECVWECGHGRLKSERSKHMIAWNVYFNCIGKFTSHFTSHLAFKSSYIHTSVNSNDSNS